MMRIGVGNNNQEITAFVEKLNSEIKAQGSPYWELLLPNVTIT